jgi:hypothetical protein
MSLRFEISAEDAKKAKIPHEIFLTNLIFNHILVFVAIISASSLAKYAVIVPIISILLMGTIIIGAQRARKNASWYVKGHWQICARRNRMFMIMLGTVGLIFGAVFAMAGGDMGPQQWAVGGPLLLFGMFTVLALVIMESDALYQASQGKLPKWIMERYPEGALEPLEQEPAH